MAAFLDTLYRARAPQRKRSSTKPMELLSLGFSRQSTDSLINALQHLGYSANSIYHSSTLLNMHQSDSIFWTTALRRKLQSTSSKSQPLPAGTIDFDSILGDMQVVTDDPANILGQELIDYYPGAKVILTGRRDANAWFNSALAAEREMFTWRLWMLSWFDVRLYYLWRMWTYVFRTFFDGGIEENGKGYARAHYVDLEDHLKTRQRGYLEWSEGDGWELLCRYLGKPVPDVPFPVSEDKGYPFDIAKVTADVTFAASWKQSAFFVLVMALAWYYRSAVWFVVFSAIRYVFTHGYVDPRGPDMSRDAFMAG